MLECTSNSSQEVNSDFKIEVVVQRVPGAGSSALLAISPTNWPVFDKATVAVKQGILKAQFPPLARSHHAALGTIHKGHPP